MLRTIKKIRRITGLELPWYSLGIKRDKTFRVLARGLVPISAQ